MFKKCLPVFILYLRIRSYSYCNIVIHIFNENMYLSLVGGELDSAHYETLLPFWEKESLYGRSV
jgi:hypothetical protein